MGGLTVLALRAAHFAAVVPDNLSTGRRAAVPDDVKSIEAELAAADRVRQVIGDYRVAAVMHFAGSIVVPESIQNHWNIISTTQ